MHTKPRYIIGIDEVGRGPLAGPVTVGVVVCEARMYTKLKRNKNLPPIGKDSKKLTQVEREKYSKVLQKLAEAGEISCAVIHVSNTIIDTQGLSFAIRKAMMDGLKKVQKMWKFNPAECDLRLDGGLHTAKEFPKQKTIIKGDEKEQIIAWASILAKVSRDALMRRASKKFPQYQFDMHKGYGTLRHRTAIQTHGLSTFHRKSFCKNIKIVY